MPKKEKNVRNEKKMFNFNGKEQRGSKKWNKLLLQFKKKQNRLKFTNIRWED